MPFGWDPDRGRLAGGTTAPRTARLRPRGAGDGTGSCPPGDAAGSAWPPALWHGG